MVVTLDKTKLHVQVICGILEEYKPSEKVQEIYKKTEELKAKVTEFQTKVLGPELEAIEKLIVEVNPKKDEE